ncbi:MAG: hypothetical protein [Microviridae sp.]|nr:MAG: hypothetical protein [Microviridae sp.]
MTREQLAEEILRTQVMYKDDIEVLDNCGNDYVLVLMEKPETQENEEYTFSLAPLFTCRQFLDVVFSEAKQEELVYNMEQLTDRKLEEQYA